MKVIFNSDIVIFAIKMFTLLHESKQGLALGYGIDATFNNISVISWWSVLLVEETGVPRENHRPTASH
jgi:hypothetical protein